MHRDGAPQMSDAPITATGALGVALAAVSGLAGLAYRSVLARIEAMEKRHDQDSSAVWNEFTTQRNDIKDLIGKVATKEDLARAEDRIVKAVRPA